MSTSGTACEKATHDVIIVGGGLAGLTAGFCLRDQDILILEQANRIGGRILSVESGSAWLNLGAHILSPPGSPDFELARTLEVGTIYPAARAAAVAMRGRIVGGGRMETLPMRLPLSTSARLSLIRAGLVLKHALRRPRQAPRRAPAAPLVTRAPDSHKRLRNRELDDLSMSDLLGRLHPDVEMLFRVPANRAGGELDTLAAGYGTQQAVGQWDCHRANVTHGTEVLIRSLATAVGDRRIRTSAPVTRVDQDDAGVRVTIGPASHPQTLSAKACILAIPAPEVLEVTALPEPKRLAVQGVRYGAYVVLGCFTEPARASWDQYYAVACPETSFQMFFNAGNGTDGSTRYRARERGSVVVYAAGERACSLLGESDRAIERLFLSDLARLFPGHPRILDTVVHRWQLGVPTVTPGWSRSQKDIAAPLGRIAFAGDYVASPGMEYAIRTATTAAQHVRSYL